METAQSIKHPEHRHSNIILIITLLCWLGLSLIALQAAQAINPDAAIYINTAIIYHQQGLSAAFASFPWPFYAILIAFTHQITHLSYLHSAYVFDLIAQLLIITGLFQLGKYFNFQKSHYIWLALLILVSPVLIQSRTEIIRDDGFLAAWIFGFSQLWHYAKTHSYRSLILYHICLLIGALFRVESLVLWLLVPVGLVFIPGITCRQAIKCYLPIFILGLFAVIVSLSTGHMSAYQDILGFVKSHIYQATMSTSYHDLNQLLMSSQDKASLAYIPVKHIFLWGLLPYFISHFILSFSWILSVFLLLGLKNFNKQTEKGFYYWAALIYLTIVVVFFLQHLFFVPRYQTGLSLLLLFPTVYGLAYVWQLKHTQKLLRAVIIIALLSMGIYHNWPKSSSRIYQTKAATWLVGRSGVICTNIQMFGFVLTQAGAQSSVIYMPIKIDGLQSINTTFKAHIKQAECHYLVLVLRQSDAGTLQQIKQQWATQLPATLVYQTQTPARVLWIFERTD